MCVERYEKASTTYQAVCRMVDETEDESLDEVRYLIQGMLDDLMQTPPSNWHTLT